MILSCIPNQRLLKKGMMGNYKIKVGGEFCTKQLDVDSVLFSVGIGKSFEEGIKSETSLTT